MRVRFQPWLAEFRDLEGDLRRFQFRLGVAGAVVLGAFGCCSAALRLPPGRPARLLPDQGRGQPHLDRPGRAEPRADPGPQRRRARAQLFRLHARDHAAARWPTSKPTINELADVVEIQPRTASASGKLREEIKGAESLPDPHAPDRRGSGALRGERVTASPAWRSRRACSASYPIGEVASHALGYIGRISDRGPRAARSATACTANYKGSDFIGKIGLEESYERELHGTTGFEQVEIDAGGRGVRTLVLDRRPSPGNNLVAHARHQAAGGRRAGVRQLPRRAGGDRPDDRRRARARLQARATTPTSSSTASTRRLGRAQQRPRQAAQQPRAARRVPAGLDLQAVHGADGARARQAHARVHDQRPGLLHAARRRAPVPRLEGRRPRHGEPAQVDRDLVRHLLLRPRAATLGIDAHPRASWRSSGSAARPASTSTASSGGLLPSREWKRKRFKPGSRSGTPATASRSASARATTWPRRCSSRSPRRSLANDGVVYQPHIVQPGASTRAPARARRIEPQPARTVTLNPKWVDLVKARDGRRHPPRRHRGARRRRAPLYACGGKTGTAQVIAMKQGEKYDEKKVAERHRDHALFIAFAPADDPDDRARHPGRERRPRQLDRRADRARGARLLPARQGAGRSSPSSTPTRRRADRMMQLAARLWDRLTGNIDGTLLLTVGADPRARPVHALQRGLREPGARRRRSS